MYLRNNRSCIHHYSRFISVSVISLLFCASAIADDQRENGWSGNLGIGVVSHATYEGSPNKRTNVLPLLSITYLDKYVGAFSLDQRGLSWGFFDKNDFRMSVLVSEDIGRESKKRKIASIFTLGDDRLKGMGDIQSTTEAGLAVGYGSFNLTARKAIGNRGHGGSLVDLGLLLPIPVSDKLGVSVGISTTWASKEYMQAYFGVTQKQAAASRFKKFTPEAGCKSTDLSLGMEYAFNESMKFQATLNRSSLVGEAKKSPIAEKKSSLTVMSGVSYTF
jgi:outer membrane protein